MKIFVTGATGFIGSSLVTSLVEKGFCVVAYARSSPVSPVRGVKYVVGGEITLFGGWAQTLKNVDVVIHLAAMAHVMNKPSTHDEASYTESNVNSTLHLALECVKAGVKRFIYISSIGVHGSRSSSKKKFLETDIARPHNLYALSKWQSENALKKICKESCLEFVIIRPPLVYGKNAPGNLSKIIRIMERGIPLPFGSIGNKRAFVSLFNLIDFIQVCIRNKNAANQTFLVSDGRDISTTQFLSAVAKHGSFPIKFFPTPIFALKILMTILGYKNKIDGLCEDLQIDITKAKEVLGWSPPLSFEESLSAMGKHPAECSKSHRY